MCLLIVSMLFTWVLAGYSQEKAYLRVSVADGVEIEESINITQWHNYIYPSSRFEREDYYAFVKSDNPFELSIQSPGYLMRISLENSKIGFSLLTALVESGDSVSIHINKVEGKILDITFSGPGSAKYRFVQELAQMKHHSASLWRYLEKYEDTKVLEQDIDKLYKQWLSSLEAFRPELSDTAYYILRADVLGYLNNHRLMLVANGYARSKDELRSDFERTLLELSLGDDILPYSPDLLALSKEYVSYLYNKEKVKLIHKYNSGFNKYELVLNAPYSFEVLYKELRNRYAGKLRDKLLAYLFVNSSDVIKFFQGVDPDEFAICLHDAMNVIQEPAMLRLLTREYEAVAKGREAYNFSLPNSDGEIVRLSDFRGQVVLLDFWGYGCGGCLSFKQRFENEVYPYLKDQSDFVFVSINADRKKEVWLKALPTYSNPEFVNLGLYELGNAHPLVKHYNIKAWPFVVLVGRDGEIISATVPLDSADLLQLIQKQLINFDM